MNVSKRFASSSESNGADTDVKVLNAPLFAETLFSLVAPEWEVIEQLANHVTVVGMT